MYMIFIINHIHHLMNEYKILIMFSQWRCQDYYKAWAKKKLQHIYRVLHKKIASK